MDKMRIKVVNREDADHDSEVIVGLNGTMYQIVEGEEVIVPRGVVEILKNTVQTKYKKAKNGKGTVSYQKERFSVFELGVVSAEPPLPVSPVEKAPQEVPEDAPPVESSEDAPGDGAKESSGEDSPVDAGSGKVEIAGVQSGAKVSPDPSLNEGADHGYNFFNQGE